MIQPHVTETNSPDALLRQYAESHDPRQSEALLEALVVNHAQPGISKIVRHKLAFQGAWESQHTEDVASEVLVELIGRLRAMKEGDAGATIGALSGYTAVAAYHACNEYLRRKYPNRHRVMNIMLVSVTERTREIGIRKAVGARKSDIIVQFLTEAVVLTTLGGIFGLTLGWLISRAVGLIFSSLPTAGPLWTAVLSVVVSMGVGLFFGIWPAGRAARLDPVVALRYE
ncbi:hypothetical protein SBA4_590008 [Candidatus Sulfopaludibacter sp. SbA4]|nr:hypothetical protein SBA4_590008 [Candidatus Sulfopaludibacter sp. SbA4]